MNEVEKMYENAGISVISQKTKDCNYCYYYEETYDAPCHVCTADKCPFEKNIIPPFTAEKQLDIIIFLINRQPLLFSLDEEQGKISRHILKIGLAGLVNRIWQSLTKEEKQQVKGILE